MINAKEIENKVVELLGDGSAFLVGVTVAPDNTIVVTIDDDDKVDIDALSKAIRKSGVNKCKKIYNIIFGDNHNSYSITLYSGRDCGEQLCLPACLHCLEQYNNKLCTVNCLYTGDYEAKNDNNFNTLKKFYSDYWNHIGLIQIPHHGSKNNKNVGLYTPEKICIISVGETDKYGHPDKITLDALIGNNSIPIIVTENQNTKQQFKYNI